MYFAILMNPTKRCSPTLFIFFAGSLNPWNPSLIKKLNVNQDPIVLPVRLGQLPGVGVADAGAAVPVVSGAASVAPLVKHLD